ncbi:MAG: pilus assembly protein TadG-related protein [Hyphomicrobiaceae bacterium]
MLRMSGWAGRPTLTTGRAETTAPSKRLLRGVRAFGRNEKGSIAILFGLTSFIVMALVGGAVDYGRAVTARNQMQNSIDAAVLAAARVWQTDHDLALAEQKAKDYYTNNQPKSVESSVTAFNADLQRSAITLTASGKLATPFLAAAAAIGKTLTGKGTPGNELTLVVTAEALLAAGGNGDSNLEIAMMLDVTGSMGGSKIKDLKEAAKDLVDIVVWQDQSEHTSRIALVPFADAVNLGSTALVNDVRGNVKTSCKKNSPCTSYSTGSPAQYFKFTNASGNTQTWQASSYCVTERVGADWDTDAAPNSSSTKVAPLYGSSSSSSCGFMSINTGDLEVNTVQPLTNDKVLLKRRIDKLDEAGSTGGQMGTAWAWYMLSPNWAYLWPSANRPVAYKTEKTEKIAILMTDGEYNTGHCNGIVAKDSGSGSGSNSDHINCNATNGSSNDQATRLCEQMKNNTGITVYTVGFALGGNKTAIKTLKGCASDESKFYNAEDGDQLRMAFRDIALQVAKLRLSH